MRFRWASNRGIISLLVLQFGGGILLSPQRIFFPLYSRSIGLSTPAVAFLNSGRQIGGMTAALIGGFLADRIGRKATYFIGNITFIVGGVIFLTDSALAISILWIASGFLLGIRTLGGQAYLVSISDSKSLGLSSAFFTWGTTLGGAVGTLLLGLTIERSGYSAFASVILVICAAVLFTNLIFMPGESQLLRRGEKAPKYRGVARTRMSLVLAGLRFLPTIYWGMAIVLIPILLADLESTTLYIAAFGTVSQVVASIAQVLAGRSSDRRGHTAVTYIVLSLLTSSILGTALGAENRVAVFVFSSIAASAAWSMSALTPVFVAKSVAVDNQARTLGWIHLFWNVGMVTGSWLGGVLYEISHALPFYVAGVAQAGTLILFRYYQKLSETG